MPNLVITKISKSILVDFGSYYGLSTEVDAKKTGYDD